MLPGSDLRDDPAEAAARLPDIETDFMSSYEDVYLPSYGITVSDVEADWAVSREDGEIYVDLLQVRILCHSARFHLRLRRGDSGRVVDMWGVSAGLIEEELYEAVEAMRPAIDSVDVQEAIAEAL